MLFNYLWSVNALITLMMVFVMGSGFSSIELSLRSSLLLVLVVLINIVMLVRAWMLRKKNELERAYFVLLVISIPACYLAYCIMRLLCLLL